MVGKELEKDEMSLCVPIYKLRQLEHLGSVEVISILGAKFSFMTIFYCSHIFLSSFLLFFLMTSIFKNNSLSG